jgi:thiamine pyrophosphate-dependent acetolactate synthase large subunit-like protein
VFNNNGYKQVADRMVRYQSASYGCELPAVDFVAVARACGCDGYSANDAASAATAVKTAVDRRKASLIEVKVQGDNLFDITPKRIQEWWGRMFEDRSQDWPY